MKKSIVIVAVIGCMVCLHFPASAQTTVLSDTFTSDSSLAQPPWYNLNNTSDASYALNPTAGQGLELTDTGTGKVNEMFAEFNTVTLSDGDYITLTVDFNSPSGMSTDTGGLLTGLYYNSTVNTANEQGSSGSGSSGTTGTTAGSDGYFGIMGYGTQAGTSDKFYSRTATATANNELGYYSDMVSGNYSQVGSSFAASGNSDLGLNINYTLTYTITDNGASGNTILATISLDGSALESWTTIDTTGTDGTGLYETFNQLDFGNYSKADAVDINMLDASIVTDGTVTVVPEPSVVALLGAGLGLIGAIRFRRR